MLTQKKDLKNFALIWSVIFFVIGLIPLLKGHEIKIWALFIAICFVLIGFFKPYLLDTFYQIWTKIGEFIGGIVSKIMLFLLFYLVFTPIAFILRTIGKDPLNKKLDKTQASYWIIREKQPESMKNQF